MVLARFEDELEDMERIPGTRIARINRRNVGYILRNPHGALYSFRYDEWKEEEKVRGQKQDGTLETRRSLPIIEPLTEDAAIKLCLRKQAEIIEEFFDLPPEADPQEKVEILYLRLPASLKFKLSAVATAQKISMNEAAVKCLEECLAAARSFHVTKT